MATLSTTAKIHLDKTGFDAALTSAGKGMEKFGTSLKNHLAGAFTVAAITRFAKSTIDAVSRVADLSKELGISTDAVQELDYASKQTGSSVEAVAKAFKALALARAEALGDSKSKAGQAFAALGMDKAALSGLSVEQIFRRVAETFRTTDFGASQLAIVSEILGRSGQELLPMFIAGIETLGQDAHKLGIIFEEGVVAQLDEVGDQIDRITAKLRVPMAGALRFVADRVSEIVDLLDMAVGGAGAWIGGFMGTPGNIVEKLRAGFEAEAEHQNAILDRRIKEQAVAVAAVENPVERQKKAFEFAGKVNSGAIRNIGGASIQSDAFQRIGAFTGVSAQSAQIDVARQQLSVLERLRDELTRRGIIIRGTD